MGRTVDDLSAELTAREFFEWIEHAGLEPWAYRDERRDDIRLARFMALFANANRDPQKQAEPFKAEQFMLFPREVVEAEPWKPEDGAHIDPMVVAWLRSEARKTERKRKEATTHG